MGQPLLASAAKLARRSGKRQMEKAPQREEKLMK
jgi:hypothetical protein